MKKVTFIFFFATIASLSNLFSQIENSDTIRIKNSIEANPWTLPTNLLNNAIIYAQVKKDGVLFQPTGVLLGVFKNDICRGFGPLQVGPTGNIHQFSYGSNENTETGFKYLVYDPTDNKTYTVTETLDFTKDLNLGRIFAPLQLNINGISAINSPKVEVVKISPNPISNQFTISLDMQYEEAAEISIFDATGKKVWNLNNVFVNESGLISVVRDNNIKNGIYFLQLTVGDKSYIEKLIFN